MFRSNCSFFLVGAIVAATLAMGVSQAEAGWWWGCYRPVTCWTPCYATCYTPCYSCCYSTCCDPCGGWYVGRRPGPIRRLLFGRYRWYYGGWGCCYNCCDYSCDTVSVCGEVETPAAVEVKKAPTPAPPQKETKPALPPEIKLPPEPKPAPEPSTSELPTDTGPVKQPAPATVLPNNSTSVPTRATSGMLTIWVPAGAKVTINGRETTSTGSRRQYVSYGLKPGFNYKYEVRAQIVRDGKLLEETKTVYLTAGAREGLAFGFNPLPAAELASLR